MFLGAVAHQARTEGACPRWEAQGLAELSPVPLLLATTQTVLATMDSPVLWLHTHCLQATLRRRGLSETWRQPSLAEGTMLET